MYGDQGSGGAGHRGSGAGKEGSGMVTIGVVCGMSTPLFKREKDHRK